MLNELQHIVPLSAIFAKGQRHSSHRISKCPTAPLQSAGCRAGHMMQVNAMCREVIKF